MSIHISSREDVLSLRRKQKLRSQITGKQIGLEALYSPSKPRIYKLKKCQRISETRCPSVKDSHSPINFTPHLNSTLSKDPSLKKKNFHSRPLSIQQSKDKSYTLDQEESQKTIALLKKEIEILKEKYEKASKEKKLNKEENSESSSVSSSDIFDFTENTKCSLDYVKNLESELKTEKEKCEKYRALYESEKESFRIVKNETLKTMNFMEVFNNEKFVGDELTLGLTLRNKELYEQVIKLSDIIFDCKSQIKELTYQRDQISDKLKEIRIQINELPEIRKHVLILLNFIQSIKTGLKNVANHEGDYFDSKKYKEEMSTLINQISTVNKGFNFKEYIAKSEFGKGLFGLVSKNFSLTDYISKNNFGLGLINTTVKNRRLTELISEIDSKLGAFSFKNS